MATATKAPAKSLSAKVVASKLGRNNLTWRRTVPPSAPDAGDGYTMTIEPGQPYVLVGREIEALAQDLECGRLNEVAISGPALQQVLAQIADDTRDGEIKRLQAAVDRLAKAIATTAQFSQREIDAIVTGK